MRASAPTAAGLKAAGVRGTRGSESKHDSNAGGQEEKAARKRRRGADTDSAASKRRRSPRLDVRFSPELSFCTKFLHSMICISFVFRNKWARGSLK